MNFGFDLWNWIIFFFFICCSRFRNLFDVRQMEWNLSEKKDTFDNHKLERKPQRIPFERQNHFKLWIFLSANCETNQNHIISNSNPISIIYLGFFFTLISYTWFICWHSGNILVKPRQNKIVMRFGCNFRSELYFIVPFNWTLFNQFFYACGDWHEVDL